VANVDDDNNQPAIELYIDELVLHGFPRRDRYQITDSVGLELMRLFSEQGLPSGFDREHAQMDLQGREIAVSPGNGAASIGVAIARSVYGSFTSTTQGKDVQWPRNDLIQALR
jgi:hypothetical protein